MFHPDGRSVLPGQDHAQDVAAKLHGIAKRVRVLELWHDWPEMHEKGDVSDWIANGGTVERLYELIEQCPDWSPPPGGNDPKPETDDDAEIARLAEDEAARLRARARGRSQEARRPQANPRQDGAGEAQGRMRPTKPQAQAPASCSKRSRPQASRNGARDIMDGSPRPSMHNARLAITALGIECSYDTFHNKILFGYADENSAARRRIDYWRGHRQRHHRACGN